MAATPADSFVLWSAVRLCKGNNGVDCPVDDWLGRLAAIDSENSLVWSQIAEHRYGAGDVTAARDALPANLQEPIEMTATPKASPEAKIVDYPGLRVVGRSRRFALLRSDNG